MTEDELWMRLEFIYELERRRALPIAQLEATIRNALGGKPKDGTVGETVPVSSLWSGEELLQDYAMPMALRNRLEGRRLVHIPDWMTLGMARGMEAAVKAGWVNNFAWLEMAKHWAAVCQVLDRAEGK